MKASLPYTFITSAKNGKQYVVFDYKDSTGKRKRKWVTTGLPEKCTKKALKEAVDQIVSEFDEQYRSGELEKPKSASIEHILHNDSLSSWYSLSCLD